MEKLLKPNPHGIPPGIWFLVKKAIINALIDVAGGQKTAIAKALGFESWKDFMYSA